MLLDIKVPAMGESISEATIGTILKDNNTYVTAEEELIELETDKVNQVLYAQKSGVVTWKVAKNEIVKIGQVIGTIDTEKSAEKPGSKQELAVPVSVKGAPQAAVPEQTVTSRSSEGVRTSRETYIAELTTHSSPMQPAKAPSPAPSAAERPAQVRGVTSTSTEERSERRQPMSRVRKTIATRLVDVLQNTAMLTTFNEVDMTQVIKLRESYKEAFAKQYAVRLGYMPFFVKAAVSAMRAFPEINAYIDGDDLVYREYFDIGIAVGTDKGLFVPVVRSCDSLSFVDIERSIEAYAKKAREGKLAPGDLQGGGFTITNGGTYGSLLSTPILNPPQSAILGMHKIEKRPVVVNDEIVIRQMMYLALSYDHRVVDGKEAVSFLVHIKNVLEDPSRLVLGI